MNIDNVLVRPVLTEKATNLSKDSVYLFEVNNDVNKFQVKETIEKLYKVKVGLVRMMIRKGKMKRVGRRSKTKQLADIKIAFVKIKEGKIDLFPQT
jgi:large subunit ribosomal protein L23